MVYLHHRWGTWAKPQAICENSAFLGAPGDVPGLAGLDRCALDRGADVQDASVYVTATGFRGRAQPRNALSANLSPEYSITRRTVLALDFQLHHNDTTRMDGVAGSAPLSLNSGSRDAFALAPALEYSWTPNIGVLVGARVIFKGNHTEASVTPTIAINYVH